MLRQAMSMTSIKGNSTIVSLGRREPIIMTLSINAIIKASTPEYTGIFPAKPVITAFINRRLNTEDAYSIWKE
jgi:hypothetical protein